MKFEELIKDPFFDFPLEQPKDENFDRFIEVKLETFLEKIKQLDDGPLNIPSVNIDGDFVKSTQEIIVRGLLKTLEEYLNGFPDRAYRKLDTVLNNDVKDLYAIIKQKKYDPNENFYRIRVKNDKENFAFSPIDLFHIPFTMRGKVSTQRYSIPGFPSLYLGRTMYVCWEELNRPEINKFQAVRFKNIKTISLLDLSPPSVTGGLTQELYRYFMTWPLIACCSVKVKDYSDIFKPEYIIPQLLLQWVRSNDRIDGICYKSNHLEPYLFKQDGELYNIVLPVKGQYYFGHCEELKKIFEITDVVSWQLYQYALGGQTFIFDSDSPQNKKLPLLELIKGRKYPYSYSILGTMEGYLDGMTSKPIE